MKTLITAVTLSCGTLAAGSAAAGAFPYPLESTTLANGLRVVFVPYDSPGLVAYYTVVRTGSRNEVEAGHSGFAHFFEHMMFRGTKKVPEFDGRMAELGWHNNAYTSDDQTVYTDFGPSPKLSAVISLEADRFQNLEYAEPAFQTEALAVLGEYNKSAAAPFMKLEETVNETAFLKHTYRHTTMGFLADIKAMPGKFAYSKKFFARYYRPNNCVIFIVGDYDRAAVTKQVEAEYGPWAGKAEQTRVPVEPVQKAARRAKVDWPAETLPKLIVAHKVPPASDWQATAAADVIFAYLFGETGTLHKQLVLDRQIAEPFESWSSAHRDPGLFSFVATAKKVEHLPEIESAIDTAFRVLREGDVDATKLALIKAHQRYALLLGLDDAEKVAQELAWRVSVTGELDAIDRYMAALDALTPADVAAFAEAHLNDSQRTTVTLTTSGAPSTEIKK